MTWNIPYPRSFVTQVTFTPGPQGADNCITSHHTHACPQRQTSSADTDRHTAWAWTRVGNPLVGRPEPVLGVKPVRRPGT